MMGAFGVENGCVPLANGEVDVNPNPVELPKPNVVVGVVVQVLVGKTKPEVVEGVDEAGVVKDPNPVDPPKLKVVGVVDGLAEDPNPVELPKLKVVDGVEDSEVLVGKTKPEVLDGADEDPNMLCYFFLAAVPVQLNLNHKVRWTKKFSR